MEFIESHLKTVLSPGSQISREPYATLKRDLKAGDIDDLRDIVRETRVVHAFVQKNKLDLYFQQVQSVAVRR